MNNSTDRREAEFEFVAKALGVLAILVIALYFTSQESEMPVDDQDEVRSSPKASIIHRNDPQSGYSVGAVGESTRKASSQENHDPTCSLLAEEEKELIQFTTDDESNDEFCLEEDFYGHRFTPEYIEGIKEQSALVICGLSAGELGKILQVEEAPCLNGAGLNEYCVTKRRNCPEGSGSIEDLSKREALDLISVTAFRKYTEDLAHLEGRENEALLKERREEDRKEYCKSKGRL